MSDFNRGGGSRDRGFHRDGGFSRGGGSFRRDSRGSSDREMFDVVCDECGKNCKVPFHPTAGKPVYCSECFEAHGGESRNRSNDRGSSDRAPRDREYSEKTSIGCDCNEKLELLSNKLNKILEILSTMKAEKAGTKNIEKDPDEVIVKKISKDKKEKEVKEIKEVKKPAKKVAKKASKK